MPNTVYEQIAVGLRRAQLVETPEEQAGRQAADALRSRVLDLAQSAVGVLIEDLSAAQIKALLAVLLYGQGAISNDGVIRPLTEWARPEA